MGMAPAMSPTSRKHRGSRPKTARCSRYRAGKSTAQPNSVARWGSIISTSTLTQRMFSPTRLVGVS